MAKGQRRTARSTRYPARAVHLTLSAETTKNVRKGSTLCHIMEIMKLLTLIASLVIATYSAQAQLGKTLAECKTNYLTNSSSGGSWQKIGETYIFILKDHKDYSMWITFTSGVATRIDYVFGNEFSRATATGLIESSIPGRGWLVEPSVDGSSDIYWSSNTGPIQYAASMSWHWLTVVSSLHPVTSVGGVEGAHQEIINGQTITVLPPQPRDDN